MKSWRKKKSAFYSMPITKEVYDELSAPGWSPPVMMKIRDGELELLAIDRPLKCMEVEESNE